MAIEREVIDTKLAAALDEIDAVLRRHSIAGAISIASSTHAAFRLTLPHWSAVKLTDAGVHIKSSSARDGKEHLASSMHLVLSLRDLAYLQSRNLIDIGETVIATLRENGVEVDHTPFGDDAGEEH